MSADTATATPAAAQRHPALELLARYRAVLAAAWAARKELAGPARLADEAAFLPAALSLQATPVHPAPRRAMWVIMALFVIALTWSLVGQVDIVAVAPGRIVVSDRTKLVQPLETSVVRAIHVRDGDKVRAGQLLIELDPTGATADKASIHAQHAVAEGEAARSRSLLQALHSGDVPSIASGDAAQQQQLRAQWSDINAKLGQLDAERSRRQAEAATHRAQLDKLEAMLPLARQREADVKELVGQGFMSAHTGQDRMRERIELERDLATQVARLREAEAALVESRNNKAAYLADTERSLNERLAEATLKAAQLGQETAKSEQRERLTRLEAPVAGTVQQLAVHTAGGVVTEAQQLMVIVPDEAEVTAEVLLSNQDIGFVRAGQHAEIKLKTFNFTRYGTVPATLLFVSADAVNDEQRGAVFPATLRLEKAKLEIDGRPVGLAPGMNVYAEIKTGRRRIFSYVYDSVYRTFDESFSER